VAKEEEDVKQFIEALEEGGWETRSYSGRSMFGRTCVSVRDSGDGFEKASAWEIAKHLFSEQYDGKFDSVPEPQQDQLGLGIVLYWPYYEWPKDVD
jgi:hypothetical protein